MHRKLSVVVVAALAALLVAAPAASAAPSKARASFGWYYGVTTLDVDPGTLSALGSLGVSPGAVAPATLEGARYSFPITNSLGSTLRSGVVRHKGGISLTAGATTVNLTDFDINLVRRQLFGRVNGSADKLPLLNLDYTGIGIRFGGGSLNIGPVTATLTDTAAGALNAAFGTTVLSSSTVLGKATIRYRVFPF